MIEIVNFEPPNLTTIAFRGKVGMEDIEIMREKWDAQSNQIVADQKFKVLVDLRELEDIPPEARKTFRISSDLPIVKLAGFGASTKVKIMAELIIRMIPDLEKAVYVETEEEARGWLAED